MTLALMHSEAMAQHAAREELAKRQVLPSGWQPTVRITSRTSPALGTGGQIDESYRQEGRGHHGRGESRDPDAGNDRSGSDPYVGRALWSLRVAEGRGRLRAPLYRRRLLVDRRSQAAARARTRGAAPTDQW